MTTTDPQRRGPRTQRDHPNLTVSACVQQLQNAELAMGRARRCLQAWLQTGQEDTLTTSARRAYHTHEALHEAHHAISRLIETLRVEAAKGRAQASC